MQPRNESRLHYRLKRTAVHILMERGCNAVGMEIQLPFAPPENAGRGTVDVAGIGPVRSGGPYGLWICECKASRADLRAGFVKIGGHRHYLVVPEALAAEAKATAPKHVGVYAVSDSGFRSVIGVPWRLVKRGAVMDQRYLPPFGLRLVEDGSAWRWLLMHIASSNSWRIRRWAMARER